MKLEKTLENLDRKYERLKDMNQKALHIRPYDLPQIVHAPNFTKSQKQKIFDQQEGFLWHGMRAEGLSTILSNFHGTAVWVPHSCNDHLSLKEFEERLYNSYYGISSRYTSMLMAVEPMETTAHEFGQVTRDAQFGSHANSFPWTFLANNYDHWHNKEPGTSKKYADLTIIKPKLTVVLFPEWHRNQTLEKYHEHIDDGLNKMWLYMAWTARNRQKI